MLLDEVGGSIPPRAAMKWKFLIISLAMGSLSLTQDTCVVDIGCTRVIKGDSLCYIHGGDLNKVIFISNQCIDYTNLKNIRCTIRSFHETELCDFHRTYYKINTNKVR